MISNRPEPSPPIKGGGDRPNRDTYYAVIMTITMVLVLWNSVIQYRRMITFDSLVALTSASIALGHRCGKAGTDLTECRRLVLRHADK